MMHIKQTLPDIKARIAASLQKYKSELDTLGDSMLGSPANVVLNIITEFSNEYRTVLEGQNSELSSTELSGGARISFVYHELYSNGIKGGGSIRPGERHRTSGLSCTTLLVLRRRCSLVH